MDTMREVEAPSRLQAVPNWVLLALAGVLLFAGQIRFGVEAFAWFLYVPLLLYLRRTRGLGSFLTAVGLMFLAWTAAILKIITEPLPWYFAFIYAVPITLFHTVG